MRGLRLTLGALAAYAGAMGALFLAAQGVAARLLELAVPDPVAFRQWGVALLLLALLAALLATEPRRYRRLLWVPLVGLPFDSAVLGYELLAGSSGLRQVGAPMAINLVLFLLLVRFYPRGQAGWPPPPADAANHEARPL